MENFESIKEIVIKEFSADNVQESYREQTRKGLWPSEKIIYTKYFKKGFSVLDIGCGSGRTTFQLAKMGYKIIGLDLTPAMINSAKNFCKEFKMKMDFRLGDATKLEFKNQSFDNAIFSFAGWDQVPGRKNRLKVLEEVYRVIRPNGYFIFTSHIRTYLSKWCFLWLIQFIKMYILRYLRFKIKEQEWGDRFFKKAKSETFHNNQYIHIPSLKEVKKQIEKAGFELVYNDCRKNVTDNDKEVKAGNCMFFVCKKT
ncbi:MAG: methyltransferase domain-containing protein [Nanoarchaeota archaeon]|nr:methyltransferase domain-containing protein [Nanoarchaeota archaeon]MBU1854566.1 methyltransferase domain-containing protein [Nanoarchaeota archaeon]